MKNNNIPFLKDSYLNFCKEIIENQDFQEEYKLIYKIWVLCDLFFIANDEFNINKNIQQELDVEIKKLNNSVIKRLLESAFIFANLSNENIEDFLSNEEKENKILEIDNIKNKAYRIAISVYCYGKYIKNYFQNHSFFENNTIIYQLFTRLGILTKSRNEILDDVDIFSLNFSLKVEATQKEIRNKFSIWEMFEKEKLQNLFKNFSCFQNDEVYFSDFQNEVIHKLIGLKTQNWQYAWNSQIISAPTSAWKTFIIKKYIIFKIIESFVFQKNINIAFVVPSKALINEIKADFIKLLQDYFLNEENISIHTNLSREDFLQNFYKKSNLFIFTPERLNYFYQDIKSSNFPLKIDILIIDEAHKVGYGYRGTLLQYIGKQIQKYNPNLQIILLAPLLKKLHKFKKEFLLENTTIEENFSHFTPVAKNEIFTNCNLKWENGFYNIEFKIKIENEEIFLFSYKYLLEEFVKNKKWKINPDNTKNMMPILAIISRFFTWKKSQSIIFRYWIESTKNQIELIQEWIKENKKENKKEKIEIWNYIWEIFPKFFNIEELLKNWLAYHNGNLPTSIKIIIEELFIDGKIQFLVANNTILEWVNLPAKNIFVHTWDYLGKTLNYFDRKNLIGRTWRLNEHLSGNVFYINFENNDIEKILTEEWLEELEFNISNTLDDAIKNNENKTKFDRYLEYIWPWDKWRLVNQYGWVMVNEQIIYQELKDFEYMTGYLISCKLENQKFTFSEQVKQYIYEKLEEKTDKLEKLNVYLTTIYRDIISKNDLEFQQILQKNIFIDPRKQMHFYDEVINWSNLFIIENIKKYSEITKMLVDNSIMWSETIKYWDMEYEKKVKFNILYLRKLIENLQIYFIPRFQYVSSKKVHNEYYYGNEIFSWKNTILPVISQWLYSISLKNIMDNPKENNFYNSIFERLKIITNQIQFEYINAMTVYFELANLWYKKYVELEWIEYNNERLDENFIYYMELWSFYPNFIYLISKWVSRESAILMWNKNIIDKFPKNRNSHLYFLQNKDTILTQLKLYKFEFIIKELNSFVYHS